MVNGEQYLILINGQDKTDSVASFHFQDGMCEVIYANSPKAYHYRAEKVQLLKVQSRITPICRLGFWNGRRSHSWIKR